MLSVGNEKLNASVMQLADIKHEKEKIEEKLRKLERTFVNKMTAGSVVPHTTEIMLPRNENFTEKRTQAFLKCIRECIM